jgi:hypothetical protein
MHTPQSTEQTPAIGRIVLWAGLAIWTVSLLRTPLPDLAGSFMHLVNLPFHEAGHIVFMPFGSFMMSLGGSLLQVLIPLICAWVFLFQQEDPFASAVCVWWTGQSLLDLSPYIDDARSLQLMLLGGPAAEVEGHDWEAILTALGWLHLDHSLARLAWVLGALLMSAALVWPALAFLQPRRKL